MRKKKSREQHDRESDMFRKTKTKKHADSLVLLYVASTACPERAQIAFFPIHSSSGSLFSYRAHCFAKHRAPTAAGEGCSRARRVPQLQPAPVTTKCSRLCFLSPGTAADATCPPRQSSSLNVARDYAAGRSMHPPENHVTLTWHSIGWDGS